MNDMHDLVAPYALDALDPGERAEFEAHLDSCESCRAEAVRLLEAGAYLAEIVTVRPPPRVKAEVMARLGLSPAAVPDARRRAAFPRWEWMVAAAAATAAIVFAGLWMAADSRLEQAETVASVYAAEDSIVVDLTSDVGSAEFAYSPALGTGVFVGQGLPPPDGDRVYQLWLVDAAGPAPAGTFRPSEAATTVVVELVQPGLTIAMTEEPAGGSALPTGEILVSAEL